MTTTGRILGGLAISGALVLAASPALAKGDASDIAAIQNLMGRYTYALDTANAEAYAMVFAPDGVMKAGSMAEQGRDNLKEYVVELRENWGLPNDGEVHWGRTRHVFTNFHVDVDGDTAEGGTYWQTYVPDAESGTWRILATGTSKETFSKIDGEWYIQTREVVGDPRPEAPAAD